MAQRTRTRDKWLAALAVALSFAAVADDAPAPQGAKVHMHGADGGYSADGYLFQPAGTGPFGAVLLIPDDAGITDYLRLQAAQLAQAGMLAVAIDLYRGQGPGAGPPGQTNALHDLNAALRFLRSMPSVRAGSVGVAAWGNGADLALHLVQSNADIRAIALTSAHSPPENQISGFHAALLGNFSGSANRRLQGLAGQLKARGCEAHFYFYPAAMGRFYDPLDTAHFRSEDATLARKRVEDFFASLPSCNTH